MFETKDQYWLKAFLLKNPINCTRFVELLKGDPAEKIPGIVGLFYIFFDQDLKAIINATLSAEQWVEAGASAQRGRVNQCPEFWRCVEDARQKLQAVYDEQEIVARGGYLQLVVDNKKSKNNAG